MATVSRRYARLGERFVRPTRSHDAAGRAPVVLMVSGGADSTALLMLAATSNLDIDDGRGSARVARERLYVLHVNHGLRGQDADADEEFVFDLASRYGIPVEAVHVDVALLASQEHDNVENAGRKVRYEAAFALADRLSKEFGTPASSARILTAHTASDRAETFLMNAVRGSGATGLASIPRRRNRVVRPLLDYTHDELCDYLRVHGQAWREDATNADTSYLRAFVRHELLPSAKERNPRVVQGIATACELLSDEDAYLSGVAARTFRATERRRAEGMLALDATRLAATEVAVARRVVRMALLQVEPEARLEHAHVEGVLELVARGTGSLTAPMGMDVRVEHGLVFFRARRNLGSTQTGWLAVPGVFELGDGRKIEARTLEVERGTSAVAFAREHASSLVAYADLRLAVGDARLWIDVPQPGDVVCPLGMHGQSKKLSDLLNDEGIPAADKPRVPVVRTSPTGTIVWVAGFRLDERVKAGERTKHLVELRLKQA